MSLVTKFLGKFITPTVPSHTFATRKFLVSGSVAVGVGVMVGVCVGVGVGQTCIVVQSLQSSCNKTEEYSEVSEVGTSLITVAQPTKLFV